MKAIGPRMNTDKHGWQKSKVENFFGFNHLVNPSSSLFILGKKLFCLPVYAAVGEVS